MAAQRVVILCATQHLDSFVECLFGDAFVILGGSIFFQQLFRFMHQQTTMHHHHVGAIFGNRWNFLKLFATSVDILKAEMDHRFHQPSVVTLLVREHAMGSIVNGLALHGGVIPYGEFHLNVRIFLYGLLLAVFFGVFSGVYPAWRMSRLHPAEALRGRTT